MAPTAKATTIDREREQTEAPRNPTNHVDCALPDRPAPALRPDDVRMLAEVGAFSPANVSSRVLDRLFSASDRVTADRLMVAAALAGGLPTLFDTPHVTAIVRAGADAGNRQGPQWRQVLTYTAMGNLEEALDEWLFNRRNEVNGVTPARISLMPAQSQPS